MIHDETLGAVPQPGDAAPGITLQADGLRRTSGEAAGQPILAVGDSYTFGYDVADEQAWPAQLQALTGRRVLNGGVNGYAFDQIVLRAEQLANRYKPAAIVVAFIADDIWRTEYARRWGADKPYFDIDGEELVLRGVPVPPRPPPGNTLTFWQRTLGHSYLLDFVLRRLDLIGAWHDDHRRAHPEGTGERLSCLMTKRLARLQRESGAPVILLAEYDPATWTQSPIGAQQVGMTKRLLACAATNGLLTIDSFPAFAATGAPQQLYVSWHLNDAGNRLIAGLAAEKLR
jgi:lysophospholipase L1-like esterase